MVFDWAPDGVLGTITGGVETADPYSLNTPLGANENFIHSGNYAASTGALAAGTYTILISMSNGVDVTDTTGPVSVPVPAALPLLASGLAGLLGWSRRRKI